jgi:hypothetical protein
MEARRHAEKDDEAAPQIRRGCRFGIPQYRQELLDRFGEVCGENQTSEIRVDSGRARAAPLLYKLWTDSHLNPENCSDFKFAI